MRQFMMTVMALTAFGAMMATAQAEILGGSPSKNGTQCFKYSPGNSKDGRFGSWGDCPQAAGTRAAPAAAPQRRSRAAASATSPAPRSVNGFEPRESAQ
jgi:hypothetical protein